MPRSPFSRSAAGPGAWVKVRPNSRGKKAATSGARRVSHKGATREEVLDRIRAVVLGSAVEMMEAVCEEGKRGSYLHAKFALEAGLLYPPPAQAADPKVAEAAEAESLAELVLKQLELTELEKKGSEAAGNREEGLRDAGIT